MNKLLRSTVPGAIMLAWLVFLKTTYGFETAALAAITGLAVAVTAIGEAAYLRARAHGGGEG